MAESKIEWTDRSDWNPIRGCTRASPGCGGPGDHGGCYAEAMAARFSDPAKDGKPAGWGHRFATRTAKGGRWTGLVAIQWDRIDLPLRWKRAAKIFASSTSDFFHESLEWDDVAMLFGVMIAAHHLHGHEFQVLTKRSDRMREWLNDQDFWDVANAAAGQHILDRVDPLNRRSDDARATCEDYGPESPPPGIWLGVSVENQEWADKRIPDLLATPAAVRFISAEPLLGPVDLTNISGAEKSRDYGSPVHGWSAIWKNNAIGREWLDWVIVGMESGRHARHQPHEVAQAIVDQCKAASVPVFVKQLSSGKPQPIKDITLFPLGLQVREMPNAAR